MSLGIGNSDTTSYRPESICSNNGRENWRHMSHPHDVSSATPTATVTATYDSPARMLASREQATDLRMRTAREARVDVLDVAEFDLLHAHLRVPEMA